MLNKQNLRVAVLLLVVLALLDGVQMYTSFQKGVSEGLVGIGHFMTHVGIVLLAMYIVWMQYARPLTLESREHWIMVVGVLLLVAGFLFIFIAPAFLQRLSLL